MYLLPSPHSFTLFHGLIFVRKGHYRRAVLPFTLQLPPSYPALPPAITFTPPAPELFHPLVAANGAVDTSHLHWQPHEQSLSHALHFIKTIFYKVEWWAAEGEGGRREARELWRINKAEFGRRVAVCVKWSVESLHDNARSLHVTQPTPQHDTLWQRIAEQWAEQEGRGGGGVEELQSGYLAWFLPGPQCLLSREDVLGAVGGRSAGKRVVVTAAEEREWMDEEWRRRAGERRQRVDAAAGKDEGEQHETQAEVEAEAEVHSATASYALDESVTPEEEDLP